jgi:type II secretory pathway component PulF
MRIHRLGPICAAGALLIAVIGGCVGAAVIALYMPMFNIINLIK